MTLSAKTPYREREVLGDECAVVDCPYERHGTSKYCLEHINPPCSGGCGKVRSVVTSEDAGKQWLCYDCREKRKIHIDDHTYYYSEDVVNPHDYIPNGEFNPHHVRPWLIGNEYGALAVVYASHEQDALDEAVDNDKLDSCLVPESEITINKHGEDCDDCGEPVTRLGNAGEPFDLTNIWMRELPNKQYARIKRHFIAMSGDHGCLPDYCDVFVTYQDAVDSLADMFELGRTRKARLFADRTLELNSSRDGAQYCEITSCTCDNPGQHSDNGVDLDEYVIRDEQTEAK